MTAIGLQMQWSMLWKVSWRKACRVDVEDAAVPAGAPVGDARVPELAESHAVPGVAPKADGQLDVAQLAAANSIRT